MFLNQSDASDCILTLHAFTTKDNPTWNLGRNETEVIILLWSCLESHQSFEHLIPNTGYKGFEVNYQGNMWLVFGQHVRLISEGGQPQYRIDNEQVMERFLLGTTSPEICQDIIDHTEAEWYMDYFTKLKSTGNK